ncbi:leucine--tRNA ligase [Stratiformator vulcanicus]|uniref:Leucine--tRNA ligase n=1 Tax=Stratiformator vulcanicus TaxID=2527980 RepID=A0A517QZD7_9PLAN|nr:leucine--tRNA ligase [Stratiformator vulcanicus]QDT36963.1 Leucine--tRNA ligase [Stratiformator vulcanicus]
MPRYDAHRIEPKWQSYWDEHGTFITPNQPEHQTSAGTYYALDMFPYPSGEGLHVGHPEGYTATDIVSRYKRMRGFHVLHPMGWDAFGLPAEQYAIKTGVHPRETTQKNIATFTGQLKRLGFSYDWSREIATTDPDYFRWTQWIFLQLYDTWYDQTFVWTDASGREIVGKGRPIAELPIPDSVSGEGEEAVRRYQDEHRLAYQSHAPVNWCPELGTVLANEEVNDGKSKEGGFPVERLPLRQWNLRITAYAERLHTELEDLDWPESIKLLQRNWIGRSTGAEVDFLIADRTAGVEGQFEEWKSRRADVGYPERPEANVIRVYTTRPDTLFGATYMVLAPEHPLVDEIVTDEQRAAVEEYRRRTASKSDLDRTDLAKEKTGVFTGAYATNPVNGAAIPIWIADYVLISYGTGAIMAVPAHDERDFEFAKTFDLPIIQVVAADGEAAKSQPAEMPKAFTETGVAINSGDYTGMPTGEFKQRVSDDLEQRGLGKKAINYKLRDWLFSRQRYWGEPFPLWHELDEEGNETGLVRPVEDTDLPVEPPEMEDFKPTGTADPPLSRAPESWLYTTADDGTRLKRETNSMPQWAGSCWYYLRYCDNKNGERFLDPELENYWLPVDLYIGGAEHAVLHLLYSRFWHKVLFDRGHLSTPEPFAKLVNQGMILGEPEMTGYRLASLPGQEQAADFKAADPAGWVSAKDIEKLKDPKSGQEVFTDRNTGRTVIAVQVPDDMVEKQGDHFVLQNSPKIAVDSRSFKMSKSRGNVINPDDVIEQYGADSLRLYEMFMGPLEATKPWQMTGVEGVYRFLARVWRTITDEEADEIRIHPAIKDVELNEEQDRLLHKTIKAVTEDVEKLSFNTAISRMMEFVNAFSAMKTRPRLMAEKFTLLLSPFAPHLAEEVWQLLGHETSLAYEPWPEFDESKLVESTIEIPVQVNGKLRAKIKVAADADPAAMEAAAKADPNVASHLEGKQVIKTIAIPGRMVNFVVKG